MLNNDSIKRYDYIKKFISDFKINQHLSDIADKIKNEYPSMDVKTYPVDSIKNKFIDWFKKRDINLYDELDKIKNCKIISFNSINIYYMGNDDDYILLAKRIYLFSKLIKQNKSIAIYCLPTPQKRIILNKPFENIDDDLKELKEKSLAFTIAGETFNIENGSEIYITKREELSKLAIHEMAHAYSLDENVGNLLEPWCVKLTNNAFEGYTELISNIFISICSAKDIKLELSKVIEIERVYSVYAVAKLLYQYGYNHTTVLDFFSGNCKPINFPVPAAYYYITRSMMFYHINELFDPEYIDLKLKATNNFTQKQREIVHKASDKSSAYMKLLIKLMQEVEINDDMSMSYMCLDVCISDKLFINYF